MRCLIFLFVALSLQLQAAFTTNYVSPTGISGNAGTSPFVPKDLQSGMNLLGPDVRIVCAIGTYPIAAGGAEYIINAHGGTPGHPAVLICETPFGAVITGNTNYGIDVYNSPYVVVQGFKCTSNTIDGFKTQSDNTLFRYCWARRNGTTGSTQPLDGSGFTSNSAGSRSNRWEFCLSEENGNGGGFGHNWYWSHEDNTLVGCIARNPNGGFNYQGYSGSTTAHQRGNWMYHCLSYGAVAKTGVVLYSGDEADGADAGTNGLLHCTIMDGVNLSWGVPCISNCVLLVSASDPTRAVNTNSVRVPSPQMDYNFSTNLVVAQGSHSFFQNVSINTLFPNSTFGQYWLSAVHPCRNMADPVNFYSMDFFGASQFSAPDIGAYTYTTALDNDFRDLSAGSPLYWALLLDPTISALLCCPR